MSASLVWKGLQSFDADKKSKKGSGGAAKNKGNLKQSLPTKRHGAKKEIKKLKREDWKKRASLLGDKELLVPSLRRARPAAKESGETDKTLENLRLLQELSKPPIELNKAEKILERATGKKILLVEKKKEDSTVFTEDDFAKFAKNYNPD